MGLPWLMSIGEVLVCVRLIGPDNGVDGERVEDGDGELGIVKDVDVGRVCEDAEGADP